MSRHPEKTVKLTVQDRAGYRHELEVKAGANLRRVLLQYGYSPYVALTQKLNCGGRGLCATCGVWIERGIPGPNHWHDRLADRYGYPRLSCQIQVEHDMEVRLPPKIIWGKRDSEKKRRTD